jgi:hypothetical protein
VASWEIYFFMACEFVLVLLTICLIVLVAIYIKRFSSIEIDPYIVTSFIMLVFAVAMRCVVNFINYGFSFTYISYTKTVTSPLSFESWYAENHHGVMHASFLLFALAIGFRKISLFINIARWFITLQSFKH